MEMIHIHYSALRLTPVTRHFHKHSCSQVGEIIVCSDKMPPAWATPCRGTKMQTHHQSRPSQPHLLLFSPTSEVWLVLRFAKVVLWAPTFAILLPRNYFFQILPEAVLSCSLTLCWNTPPQGGLPRLRNLKPAPPHRSTMLHFLMTLPGITCLLVHFL